MESGECVPSYDDFAGRPPAAENFDAGTLPSGLD
jgi:hypothetical protein